MQKLIYTLGANYRKGSSGETHVYTVSSERLKLRCFQAHRHTINCTQTQIIFDKQTSFFQFLKLDHTWGPDNQVEHRARLNVSVTFSTCSKVNHNTMAAF